MPKTKIISFQPVTRELRAAIKAEGLDGPVTNKTDMWAEVEAMTQADDPRNVLEIGGGTYPASTAPLTSSAFSSPTPHAFILPRGGGDVGLLRALVLSDLHDTLNEDEAPIAAYVWSPGHTKLAKVFPEN